MLLDDEFPIGKVLPNWAPFPTGLVVLGFSKTKKVYYNRYHVFTCNIRCFASLGTQEPINIMVHN